MQKLVESASREKSAGGFSFEQVEKQRTDDGIYNTQHSQQTSA